MSYKATIISIVLPLLIATSTQARFLQADPAGYAPDLNQYTYVQNNPINLSDPFGLAPGDPFDTPAQAGYDAAYTYNPKSIEENLEYNGPVYRGTNGKFFAGLGPPGKGDSFRFEYTGPKGSLYGDWHSHGSYSKYDRDGRIVRTNKSGDQFDSDNFSSKDKRGSKQRMLDFENKEYRSYLGTPSGDIKMYDPVTGQATTMNPANKSSSNQPAAPWSVNGDQITGSPANGSRICPIQNGRGPNTTC